MVNFIPYSAFLKLTGFGPYDIRAKTIRTKNDTGMQTYNLSCHLLFSFFSSAGAGAGAG